SGPANGVLGTNQTVTMLFGLRDAAGLNATNLIASLLATNGISGVSPSSQTYGALLANGPSKSFPFSFTIAGTNGQNVAATFQVHDGNGPTNLVLFNFLLGSATTSFSNVFPIIINDYTNATPYPSVINVSGVNGAVGKATVLVTNLNHTWPSDIDMLLESPSGASTYLMSKCGGSYTINNVTLTFDDASANYLPNASLITSGTYHPTSFAATPPPFPVPAPPPHPGPPAYYSTNLSVFADSNPNGAWSLFIISDTPLNAGIISNGWVLNLITTSAIIGASDVGIEMTGATNAVESNSLSYTISVTNYGPSTASNVVVSDFLPAGVAYLNAVPSLGSAGTNGAGLLTWSNATLAVNAGATLTLTVQPLVVGSVTNTASVTTGTTDPNPADSSATVVTSVAQPAAQLVMTLLSSTPNVLQPPAQSTYVLTVTITNAGPSAAPSTIITVNLPPMVNPLGGSPASWVSSIVTNNSSGDVVTFAIPGEFAVGASATVALTNQPTASGSLLNYAASSSA